MAAYHVDYFQVSSKTPIDRETFDLEANVPEENATREQFRAMLRNLLEERFHLKAHVESREFAAYELVVAKSGLKMKESGAAAPASEDSRRPPDEGFPDLPPGRPGPYRAEHDSQWLPADPLTGAAGTAFRAGGHSAHAGRRTGCR